MILALKELETFICLTSIACSLIESIFNAII